MISLRKLFIKFINSIKLYRVRSNHLLTGLLITMVGCIGYKFVYDHRWTAHVPRHLAGYQRFREGYVLPENDLNEVQLDHLVSKVEKLNHDAEIFNWDKFGAFKPDTDIIAIQVHKDVERLQYLIISLAQVQNIQKVLLIFSHSYYDDNINRLVRSIRFAKVMQIFYPYSLQLNPGRFPGMDPDDCNTSARLPHRNCLERDARLTQHKQHWWWKVNFIFQGCEWSDSYRGIVIFMEECDYVFPDLLYMLSYARHAMAHFPTVDVISFGRPHSANLDYGLFTVDTWRPLYDRGLAFNRTTWLKIAALSSHFCFYNDYSWSYSLVHLFKRFPRGSAEMLGATAPRVVSWGGPSGRAAALAAGSAVRRAAGRLFPRPVRAALVFGREGRVRRGWVSPPRGNGGWADLRDQLLCLDPLLSTEPATDTTFMFDNYGVKNIKNESHLNYFSSFYLSFFQWSD